MKDHVKVEETVNLITLCHITLQKHYNSVLCIHLASIKTQTNHSNGSHHLPLSK